MPIYTYRCEECGVQFERNQKFSDPPLTRCPECNKKALRKVYTPVGVIFKGSGFYATDNRSPSGSRTTSESKDDGAKERASGTTETKSENKSADTAESKKETKAAVKTEKK